jgi:hypothetical protein
MQTPQATRHRGIPSPCPRPYIGPALPSSSSPSSHRCLGGGVAHGEEDVGLHGASGRLALGVLDARRLHVHLHQEPARATHTAIRVNKGCIIIIIIIIITSDTAASASTTAASSSSLNAGGARLQGGSGEFVPGCRSQSDVAQAPAKAQATHSPPGQELASVSTEGLSDSPQVGEG